MEVPRRATHWRAVTLARGQADQVVTSKDVSRCSGIRTIRLYEQARPRDPDRFVRMALWMADARRGGRMVPFHNERGIAVYRCITKLVLRGRERLCHNSILTPRVRPSTSVPRHQRPYPQHLVHPSTAASSQTTCQHSSDGRFCIVGILLKNLSSRMVRTSWQCRYGGRWR